MNSGIYKITNIVNNKVYIGCSKNIKQRWISHKSEAFNEKHIQYNYSIHKAFRKYGLENFLFEIIEEILDEKEMFEKEKYWIKYYNSYINGYNETEGGDCGPSLPGEKNPNVKLTEKDVIQIRTLLLEGKMPSEVYPLFEDRISLRGFQHIWRGTSWPNIMPEAIEYFKSKEYLSKARSFASKKGHKPMDRIRNEIKEKKEKGLNRLDVYEEYKNFYSLSGFNKVWYKK